MQKSIEKGCGIILHSITMLFSSNCVHMVQMRVSIIEQKKARVESLNESDEVQESDLQDLNI